MKFRALFPSHLGLLDLINNPRFSPDSKKVIYSFNHGQIVDVLTSIESPAPAYNLGINPDYARNGRVAFQNGSELYISYPSGTASQDLGFSGAFPDAY